MNKEIYNELTSFVGQEHSSSNFLNSLDYKDNGKRLTKIITDLKEIFDIEIREGYKSEELIEDEVLTIDREEDKEFKSCKFVSLKEENLTSIKSYIEDNYINEIKDIKIENELLYLILK
jgi:molybdopterin-guanine dinucleotide biosynthesis protein